MGPSGVGKDTLVFEMIERDDLPHIHRNQSWTTRAKRETDPDDMYNFVSKAEFIEAEDSDQFLQTNKSIYDKWYGTPWPSELPDDTVELFILLAESAQKVKEYYPNAKSYLILPPSINELKDRLRGRGDSSEEDLIKREEAALKEIAEAKKVADYELINETGKITESASKLHRLIREDWEKLRSS